MQLRYYQNDCVDTIYEYLANTDKNALAVLPTGTGKSLILAEICRRALSYDPYVKIMVATHSKELISQNAEKLRILAPDLDIGIFSSGLGKKQRGAQFIFAGVQSAYSHAFDFGKVDILCIDEVHTVPRSETGTWRKFIADLTTSNPQLRIIGLSATPFRMTQGNIFGGDDCLFDEICYEYELIEAFEKGYLCPPTNRPTETHISTEGVHKRGGEFIAGELEAAINIDSITQECVKEIITQCLTRNCCLVFCAGVKHAEAVRDAIRAHGQTCETVTGETPTGERDNILRKFANGEIKYVTNANVLTVGYDNSRIDAICCLRPTGSAGLWIQMLGRSFRLHESKTNALILDFTDNTTRFGAIDKIRGCDKRTSGKGEAPKKLCPVCMEIVPASIMVCPNCQTVFSGSDGPELNRNAATDALLSNQIKPELLQVSSVSYARHEKAGKPPTLRVDYRCGLQVVSEWVCIGHDLGSYPRRKAMMWWAKRTDGGQPDGLDQALSARNELRKPTGIWVRNVSGKKYKEVVGYEF